MNQISDERKREIVVAYQQAAAAMGQAAALLKVCREYTITAEDLERWISGHMNGPTY